MAMSSIVLRSALENFLDWSSEYYQPRFMSLAKIVRKWPIKKVRTVAYVTDGEHGSPDWDECSEIRYVTAEHIKPNEIADLPMRTISYRQDMRNARCHLQEGDVLVYSVGAYAGFAACAEPHLFPASIPRSVAIIRIRDKESLKPGFLSVFLNSKYGLFQSYRFRAGNSQPVLALEKIRQYEIPLLPEKFQNQMQELYDNAYQARRDAQTLYIQAQQLLESELDLDKLNFGQPVGYVARFSELELSHRADAQHFQPRYAQLLEHLAQFPTKRVRDIRRYNQRGIQPIYVEDGTYAVVNSQHLGPKHINYNGLQKTTEQVFNASPEAHIQPEDLLIYTTGAYIGRTNVYLDTTPALASNHVNILRLSQDIDHAYMAVVFQSIVGQFQTQKHARGSAQAELYPADIDKFIVPLLSPGKQRDIGNLVRKSLAKQLKSEQLLEQAKSRVEQLIEEGCPDI